MLMCFLAIEAHHAPVAGEGGRAPEMGISAVRSSLATRWSGDAGREHRHGSDTESGCLQQTTSVNELAPQIVSTIMDRIERYRTYRKEGQELNSKLLDVLADDELMESARFLGMTVERQGEEILYHEGELDMAVQSDFALNEYRTDDTTAVERYYTDQRWETPVERDILEALRQSYKSLFEIVTVNPDDRTLVVKDLLSDDALSELTDLRLSETAEPGALLFYRPVQIDDFTMTSGFMLPFSNKHRNHLFTVNRKVLNEATSRPNSVIRFYTFYRLYQKYGGIGFAANID